MGHNLTERGLQKRIANLAQTDTPGWQLIGSRWAKVTTVDGAILRRAELRARCGAAPECGRRVVVDLAKWSRMGFGALDLKEVRAAHSCGLTPCRLSWETDRYRNGPPLMCWANMPNTKVVVGCLRCGAEHSRGVADFAIALHRAGVASGNISYRSLGGHLIRGACRRCGEHAWRVRLHPDPGPKVESFGGAD